MNRRYVIYTAESKAAQSRRIKAGWRRKKARDKKKMEQLQ